MSNLRLAVNLAALVLGMLCLAYASVPLYRLFCQVTGFGGTTQVAATAPTQISDRIITIRFNADTDPALPWQFHPGEAKKEVRVGEEMLSFYTARNLVNTSVRGHAVYNVLPNKAGPYFMKIECFCFTEQTLQPGQEVHMPVTFFLDPSLLSDPNMDDVHTITLSYTFFAVTEK